MDALSDREAEVLVLLVEGLSDRVIGERLIIQERTVRSHTYTIYSKLGVKTRTQAVLVVLNEELRNAHAKTAELQKRIEDAQKELSHMAYFLGRAVETVAKLGAE